MIGIRRCNPLFWQPKIEEMLCWCCDLVRKILFFLLDGNQFNFKNQGRIWPDDTSLSLLAIGEIGRNEELPFCSLLQEAFLAGGPH